MISEKIEISNRDLFDALKDVLGELNISITDASFNKGVIVGKTKASFLSWGETISIKLTPIDSCITMVEIESSSNAQLIDWGTNSKNENDILNKIKSIIH